MSNKPFVCQRMTSIEDCSHSFFDASSLVAFRHRLRSDELKQNSSPRSFIHLLTTMSLDSEEKTLIHYATEGLSSFA